MHGNEQGEIMSKRRSHGKIDHLPFKLRCEVERQLVRGVTYEKIAQYLRNLGYDIHYMSVYRYGKPYLKRFEAVKEASERARTLAGQS